MPNVVCSSLFSMKFDRQIYQMLNSLALIIKNWSSGQKYVWLGKKGGEQVVCWLLKTNWTTWTKSCPGAKERRRQQVVHWLLKIRTKWITYCLSAKERRRQQNVRWLLKIREKNGKHPVWCERKTSATACVGYWKFEQNG